mmetsp:Transcript_19733/g.16898  ORF Transcript_19733/g.16898 Transcript_19733/m.16898 type:complete len:102 (-) Transcript_19733:774-1079(-)
MSIISLIIAILSCWFVIGLFGYHTYLLATDQTTNEQLKGAWKREAGNPFTRQNFWKGMYKLICRAWRKSRLNFKEKVILDFGRDQNPTYKTGQNGNIGREE